MTQKRTGQPVMDVQLRAAQLQPATFNEGDNSIDCVWTTGSRRRAYDWYNDTLFEEELDVSPDAVDMSRFDAGAVQVLDSHQTYGGVGAILGIASRGAVADGQGTATISLSRDPAKAGVVGDIKAGVIRAMSFGYSVQKYEITRAQDRTDGINLPLYRAVRWTPQELSFVPVPADPNAGTRSAGDALTRSEPKHAVPCEFIYRAEAQIQESNMTEAERAAAAAADEAKRQQDARDAAARAEQAIADARAEQVKRAADIAELCSRHGATHLVAGLVRDGKTVEQASAVVLEDIARRDAAGGGHQNSRVVKVGDEAETRMQGMEEALHARVNAKAKLGDHGRQFRGMSLLEMGRDWLEYRGVNTRGLDRMQLAGKILTYRSGGSLTTSDFASLLANVMNKRLRQGYEENPSSYSMWARRAPNAPDFKSMQVTQLGAAPDLLQTNEHGEFKYGSMTDGKETYSMLTYGRIVSLSRQAVINDDLRGFDRLISAFGFSAARLENRTVYAILTANAALSDTGNLFNSTAVTTAGGHANLTGSGTVISVANLAIARAAMRVQKGLQSEELNIAPRYLIVPAALEQIAYQFTSNQYVPALAASINEFRAGGRTSLEPVVEAILDANSATAWYLAADTGQIDTVEYCYLDGAEGPVIESELGFEVDGISYKCRLDFAAKAIDFRGLYKNPGA
jgi:phage major head subunit gpT-like protein/phage head maturation protease